MNEQTCSDGHDQFEDATVDASSALRTAWCESVFLDIYRGPTALRLLGAERAEAVGRDAAAHSAASPFWGGDPRFVAGSADLEGAGLRGGSCVERRRSRARGGAS